MTMTTGDFPAITDTREAGLEQALAELNSENLDLQDQLAEAQRNITILIRTLAALLPDEPHITADSPAALDAEAERLAREERWS